MEREPLQEDDSGVTFEVIEGEIQGDKPVRSKGVYLLPNLFTTAALFSGFYCVIAAMNGSFENAAMAIFIAGVLDGLDGRVARMTNTQSAFGTEYDSLSDVVAFGVAPATLAYSWILDSYGKLGWMCAFVFVACAALRLARFNTQVDVADKRYFTGLSSPVAAGFVASLIWVGVEQNAGQSLFGILVAATVLVAALLMVSNIPFYSFKDLGSKGRVPFRMMLAMISIFVLIFIDPPKILLLMSVVYTISGPLLAYRKKKQFNA